MRNNVFVVNCERIPRRNVYHVRYPINDQLSNIIKSLPEGTYKWSAINHAWEIDIYSLYLLIKKFKKVSDIFFNFGNEDSRKVFITQINKIKVDEKKKREFIADLNIKKENWVKYKEELEVSYKEYYEKFNELLNGKITPYPHQIVAAMFMNATKNTLISHEMGTGKTISSILYIKMNNYEKVIIITPNSLKFNYYNEVINFTDSYAHIVNWKNNTCSIDDAKYIILNYEYFNPSNKGNRKKLKDKWKELGIDVIDAVICDESHRLKNTKSNTYKNFKSLFTDKLFRDGQISKIFLSGTPAPNRAYELYTVLNQISPTDFPRKNDFMKYYCGMSYDFENGWGWTGSSAEDRLEELFHKIAPYTHRKKKSEVLKDLPDKMYQRINLEMSKVEDDTYFEIENNIINDFLVTKNSNPLTVMLRLRQYTSKIKINYVKELIENVIDSGEKVVVVDMFKESLYDLKNIYGDIAVIHTGDQSVEERANMVKEFQDPKSKIKIFLGSIQTCNYGLTLTAASKLIIVSLPYSVGEFDQVSDRLHRIGQKNPVNIYLMIYNTTVDEYIYNSIEGKRKEIVKVIDNEKYESSVSDSVISEVINLIKRKHGKSL